MKLNILLKEIENCRKEMVNLASKYSLSHGEVIETSKKLDKLLNEYSKKSRS
ncbi:aspartyl-phosphate phosphatase Spo0E family protein [Bacillus sp. B15-48]|uniref:aspartyl-phosphate phosphatase Spo0E family protein n=1 Tax=Bacillus sp. B15-48 TaxID=1548601 RepID=UPI00193F1803|nr:aspartyl-phosphate phosphatase Spo0E family protein [Bacillus sp. B15-48]MBM4765409.1 Spo0E family sporulation regulatory protein-aspartic acid phosphatase [Bacillus sp. B15-48]